jgi:predicted DNA-binding antitoxin AbrB/MazE fold protein
MKVAKRIDGRFVFRPKAMVTFEDGEEHEILVKSNCNPVVEVNKYVEKLTTMDDVDYFVKVGGSFGDPTGQSFIISDPTTLDIVATVKFRYEMEDVTVA